MKILVTGGAGYIGSILTGFLLQDGHDVTILDNFMWGQTSLASYCFNRRLKIERGDARDMRIVKPLIRNADVLIPLAALVGAPLCESRVQDAMSTNCEAIKDTVSMMTMGQMIVIPISNSGYGIGEKDQECTEESPLRPLSVYGQSKVKAEKIVMDAGNAVSLRLATVFGMSQRMRLDLLVNDFVWRAIKDRFIVLFEAHFRRNYVHIRDVAHAFCHALDNWDDMKDHVFNVGLSEANMTKWQLCERIKKHLPDFHVMESPIGEDPDKRDYVVSNAKIEAAGWRPQYSLDDGIVELIKGYRMLRTCEHGNI